MSTRHRTYGPRDDAPAIDGDRGWVGVNMKLEPDKLEPGIARRAINKSFRTGTAATRGGILTTLFHNPGRQPGQTVQPIYGAALYADATGLEHLLLARANEVWICREGRAPATLTLPETLSAACDLVQFVDRVWLFRGADLLPWMWDGTSAGFVVADQALPGDGTIPFPGVTTAEVVSNRLAAIVGRDEVIFSDILRGGFYDPLAAQVRVNAGTTETLVRLFPYYGNNMLAFAAQGIYMLENVAGDLSELTLTEVNRELGCVARRSVASVGSDVFFLAGDGVYAISQVVESRIATRPVAVSEAIEPFFRERVNWRAAHKASAAVAGEYYYLALPIDGASDNNALLPYNTTTQQWEGWHTFPANVYLSRLVVTDWAGRRRLFAVDALGRTYLTDEGMCDRVMGGQFEISDLLETRGYLFGDQGRKRSARVRLTLETWRPRFSVTRRTDGVNETETLLSNETRDRTRYTTWNTPAYDTTNANGDHAAPYREDYSVTLTGPFQPRSGIVFDRRQSSEESLTVRARGRYFTVEIANTQGRCDVTGLLGEATPADRNQHTHT